MGLFSRLVGAATGANSFQHKRRLALAAAVQYALEPLERRTLLNGAGQLPSQSTTGSESPVVATALPVRLLDSKSPSAVAVATFTDPGNPPGDPVPPSYAVTIDWGDKSPVSTGSVTQIGRLFVVTGSHVYTGEGTYPIATTISDEGTITQVTGTATVSDNIGILLLDSTGANALDVTGKGAVTVNNGGTIQVDSANAQAATLTGQGHVVAADIDVTGGAETTGQAVFSVPVDHEAPAPDPLNLPLPPAPSTTFPAVNYSGAIPLTLSPGTYLGGIKITGLGNVTLLPGIYYMQGGGFTVTGQGSVSGSGVLLVNAGGSAGPIALTGQGNVSITAPTNLTGALSKYNGVAVLQDPASSVAINITGQGSVSLGGSLYAPRATLDATGSGGLKVNATAGQAQIIVADLRATGLGNVTVNSHAQAPSLAAGLANDTGISNTDHITYDDTVVGAVIAATSLGGPITGLKAGFDAGSPIAFTDVTSALKSDGTFLLSSANLNAVFGGQVPDGAHVLHLQASDAAGDTSAVFDLPFLLDTAPPTVKVTSPAPLSLSNTNFTVSGQTIDSLSGVVSLQAQIDGSSFVPVSFDSAGNFQFQTQLPLNGSADGSHSISFLATDKAGNVSAPATLKIVLDTQPPVISIDSPSASLDVNHNITISGHVLDALSGVASLNARLDSGSTVALNVGPTGMFSFTTALPLDESADGQHTVQFLAIDRAGNASPPSNYTFTLDTTPPPVSFDLDPASDTPPVGDHTTRDSIVTLTGTTEPNTHVVLAQTGATGVSDASGVFHFTNVALVAGPNPFTVIATDAAGNNGTAQQTIILQTSVHLVEGTNFRTVLQQTFTVPSQPSILQFTYANLNFAIGAPFVNDAFEAAISGPNESSPVYTIGSGLQAYFNITKGSPQALAQGVEANGQTVSLDLSQLTPGSQIMLTLRLVNDDTTTTTSVDITDVHLQSGVLPAGGTLGPVNLPVVSSPPASSSGTNQDQPTLPVVGGTTPDGPVTASSASSGVVHVTAGAAAAHVPSGQTALISGQATTTGTTLTIPPGHGPYVPSTTMTLSGSAAAAGYALTNFATGFPTLSTVGPLGIGFLANGSVMVGDYQGNVRVFSTDNDGQAAGAAPVGQNYGQANPLGIAQVGQTFYLAEQSAGYIIQVNPDGGYNQTIVSMPGATGLTASPDGHLFCSASGGIWEVDPVAKTRTLFVSDGADGLGVSGNGAILYAEVGGHIIGYNIASRARVFDSGLIANNPDGMALGVGALAGTVFVNTNGGTVVRVDLATDAQTVIASGGSRGDFVAVDPTDGTLLLTQSDRILRLTAPLGSGFGRVVPNSILSVTVNGVPVSSLDANGNFYFPTTIQPGQNNFVIVATDSSGQIAGTTLSLYGDSSVSNTSAVVDVAGSVTPVFGRTTFNDTSSTLYSQVAVFNAGKTSIDEPLYVGVEHLSDASIQVLHPDGYTDTGVPYFDYSSLVTGLHFNAGDTTAFREIAFYNPGKVQFSFDLVPLAQVNQAPQITSAPPVKAITGQTYTYPVTAIDTDGDPLTYSLRSAPSAMTINPASGLITWNPSTADIGNQSISIVVSDGQGGTAEQDYTLFVTAPQPNSPPEFITTPVVDATVHQPPYEYSSKAVDPDGDPVTYALTQWPAGMTVDPTTGQVLWSPTAAALNGGVQDIVAQSTFDNPASGSDGWVATEQGSGGVNNLTYHASAGHSGGYISADDIGDGLFWYWRAPSKFLGDKSVVYGGSLSFDLRQHYDSGEGPNEEAAEGDVILAGAGNTLFYRTGVFPAIGDVYPGTGGAWTSYNVPLSETAGWHLGSIYGPSVSAAQMQATLASLTSLSIRGEYQYGDDHGDLDNPTLAAPRQPLPNQYPVTLTASDGRGGVATQSYIVTVHPDPTDNPPVIVSKPQTSAVVGTGYEYDVVAVDADKDPLTYSLTTAPSGVSIVPATGVVSWATPSLGAYPITVRVDDGRGGFDTQTYTVTVNAPGTGEITGTVFNDINGNGSLDPGRLLVASEGSNAIVSYDATTGAFQGDFVTAGSGGLYDPNGLLFGPDGLLYVDNFRGGPAQVLRFNGQTGAFIDQFVPPSSGGLAAATELLIGPDGNLYVGSNATGSILRYSGKTGAFIDAFIPAGSGGLTSTSGFTFGPDGSLYVADYNSSSVLRFDGATGAFLGIFVTPGSGGLSGPQGVAFGPDGNFYVEGLLNNAIGRYDGKTGAFLNTFVSGNGLNGPIEFQFVRNSLYVDNYNSSQILQFDAMTGAFRSVFVSGQSSGLIHPNGMLFTADPGLLRWTVYLDQNNNGRLDPGEPFTTTDSYGNYSFTGLAAGTYIVREVPQPGWQQTAPTSLFYSATINGGQIITGDDFGNHQVATNSPTQPPYFTSPPPTVATVGTALQYAATAVDPQNSPLTYDLTVAPSGMAVDPATGVLVWTPAASQVGYSSVILRVRDGLGGVALQSFQIDVGSTNHPPMITSTPTGPAVVGVKYQYDVTAVDPDNNSISFSLTSPPSGMTIDPATGILTWTPASAQVGSAPIVITASDGLGGTDTQTFDLPVVATATNAPPTITSTPGQFGEPGQQYQYAVIATDPNGDPLSYQLTAAPAGMSITSGGLITWTPTAAEVGSVQQVAILVSDTRGATATQTYGISVVSQIVDQAPVITSVPPTAAIVGNSLKYAATATDAASNVLLWSLDSAPAGMAIDPSTGVVVWQPQANQLGIQQVALRVTDEHGSYAIQNFSISVTSVYLPPNITSDPPTSGSVGVAYTYAVAATDPNGSTLTYSLTTTPAGMSIDPASGLISWKPVAAEVGNNTVVVRATNAYGGYCEQDFTVVVSSSGQTLPPQITSTPPYVAQPSLLYTYDVTAVDPAGNPVHYVLNSGPAGMTIDGNTGIVSWTPTAQQTGTFAVSLSVLNSAGASATQTYQVVSFIDHAPVITSQPVLTATAGGAYVYTVIATDQDNNPLSIQLNTAPAGMTVDNYGNIAWNPTLSDIGPHPVQVTVQDNFGMSATQSFVVTVAADTTAPNVQIIANPVANLNDVVNIRVSATDNVGVTGRTLMVDGQAVAIDANGVAAVKLTRAGDIALSATATDAAGNVGTATGDIQVIDPTDTSAPVVNITSPADGTMVTSIINVTGTVSDSNLLYYTLAIAPADGSGAFQEIYRSTQTVSNGVLGAFDPSMLQDNAYLLRLYAVNAGGHSSEQEVQVNVAGNLKLGNFTLSFTDLQVPVSGIPITVSRTYDTLNANQSEDFGYGWRLEFGNTDLRTSVPAPDPSSGLSYNGFTPGARVYVTVPGGKREGFTFNPVPAAGLEGSFLGILVPQFTADPGVTDTLTVDNFPISYNPATGQFQDFNGDLPYNPADTAFGSGQYTLTTKAGITYKIDGTTGSMQSVSDANGNKLTFSSTGITSSSGVSVTFQRDPEGRIIGVTDPDGKTISYAYDSAGDLVSVTDRDGNVTKYDYLSTPAHYLNQVIDPLGRTGLKSTYGPDGRLSSIVNANGQTVDLSFDTADSLQTITDALGNPTVYGYDDRGNITLEIAPDGGKTTRTFDANNNLLSETDPNGNTTSYTYDAKGNVLTQTDPMGNVTRYTYNLLNKPLTITDPLGNTTTNTYDSVGNLLTTTDPSGATQAYQYDSAGNVVSTTDAAGNVTTMQYDGAGNLTREQDALGHVTTYTYDAAGNRLTSTTTLTTPSGVRTLVTSSTYDSQGHQLSQTDAEGNVTHSEYNADGQLTASVDAAGNRTEYQYDTAGRLIATLFPDGTSTSTTYDAAGNRLTTTDQAGHVTAYKYDLMNRLIETDYPDGSRTTTGYDLAGRVISETDALGNTTQYGYDADGNRVKVTDALGDVTTSTYNAAGQQLTQTDPLGHVTTYVYDAAGRKLSTIFADGSKTSTKYDALGRDIQDTDANGNTTQFGYDALGHLTSVTDALGQVTTYAYDEAGDLISQTDANGHTTHYEYNGLGQRTATILPMGQRSTTTYGPTGNVVSTTDYNGQTTTYTYDSMNRLIAEHFADGTSETFTYTPTSQRASDTTPLGTTTYTYDYRGNLLSRTDPDGTSISYTYDAVGNRLTTTSPAGTVTYTFDALNRMSTVSTPAVGTTTYAYDADGDLIRTTQPNGIVELRQYDALNQLTLIEATGPGNIPVTAFAYTLDAAGNRIRVDELGGRSVTYTYDALYRLTKEAIIDTSSGNRVMGYTYDAAGNRLTRTDTVGGTTTYSYDANDRLLSETTAGVATAYTYDNNGNMLSSKSDVETSIYEYDAQNHLVTTSVTRASQTNVVTYAYNSQGIQVSRTQNGIETKYLLDTSFPNTQVDEEYAPDCTAVVLYTWGISLIAQVRNAAVSYFESDSLGSTRALTNASGVITDTYAYDAFGRQLTQSGDTVNSYLFVGEETDGITGLDYMRARAYDPANGAFVARDPLNGNQRVPISLNPFIYVGDDPVNRIDPSGQQFVVEIAVSLSIDTDIDAAYTNSLLNGFQSTLRIVNAQLRPAEQMRDLGLQLVAEGSPAGMAFYLEGSRLEAQAYGDIGSALAQVYPDAIKSLVSFHLGVTAGLDDTIRAVQLGRQVLGAVDKISKFSGAVGSWLDAIANLYGATGNQLPDAVTNVQTLFNGVNAALKDIDDPTILSIFNLGFP